MCCSRSMAKGDYLRAVEQLLDDSVGAPVKLELERGGQLVTQQLRVQDLEEIRCELSASRRCRCTYAVVATSASLECASAWVYVANPGYIFGSSGIARGSVIVDVNVRRHSRSAISSALFRS